MPLEYVLDSLPMAQGFALIAWGTENNPWGAVRRVSDGYLAQEGYRNT